MLYLLYFSVTFYSAEKNWCIFFKCRTTLITGNLLCFFKTYFLREMSSKEVDTEKCCEKALENHCTGYAVVCDLHLVWCESRSVHYV